MSGSHPLSGFRRRFERLCAQLDAVANGTALEDRNRLRSEIIELFRDSETALVELAAFKQDIRGLVERFKALPAAPIPPRVDHLGSSTFLERGWGLIVAGEYERAAQALRHALELAPDDAGAETMLGWALMLAAEYDEALLRLQKVLARDPTNLMARANIGYICLKKGIFGEAVEHLSRVLRAETDRKATLYANFYMGLLYLEREMYGDAKNFLARALELGPNLIEAWWELGRACYLEGSPADAARAWRHGVESNRFSIWGARCAAALSALEAGEVVSFG
jgi:tetratricopeptide (TPR) repeat protein